jgi:hypothetical protein
MAARLVVVEQVHHQEQGSAPVSLDTRYTVELSSDEEPYVRRLNVGEETARLDFGWAKDPAMLVLRHERPVRSVHPGAEEAAADEARRVVLLVGDRAFAAVRPGCSLRMEPTAGAELNVRCTQGSAKCTIMVVPG